MSSLFKARLAFTIAIGLLLACALVVYGTLKGFTESEHLVVRTQQVQVLLGECPYWSSGPGRRATSQNGAYNDARISRPASFPVIRASASGVRLSQESVSSPFSPLDVLIFKCAMTDPGKL